MYKWKIFFLFRRNVNQAVFKYSTIQEDIFYKRKTCILLFQLQSLSCWLQGSVRVNSRQTTAIYVTKSSPWHEGHSVNLPSAFNRKACVIPVKKSSFNLWHVWSFFLDLYIRNSMSSIQAPKCVWGHASHYGSIQGEHAFQKLWKCNCESVKNFEGNTYLFSLVTFHPCALKCRPRQIHYTAGVWEMKASLVSPKVTQSKAGAFFWQTRAPLEDRNLCFCQHAHYRCTASWWNSSHAGFKKVERILCWAWRTHWRELVRLFFVLSFILSSCLFLCDRCALSPLLPGSLWSLKAPSSVEQSPVKLALPSPSFRQSSLHWLTSTDDVFVWNKRLSHRANEHTVVCLTPKYIWRMKCIVLSHK